jgi:acyl-CoA thioester hydrolase
MAELPEMLRQRESFRAWARVSVRYNDLDPLGHVNNAAMAVYLEQARCELITPLLKAERKSLDIVLAATSISYLEELHYPGLVEVGTVARRIGSKSMSLEHGVFQNDRCAGVASVVLVTFDLETRTSVPVPESVRALLATLGPRAEASAPR